MKMELFMIGRMHSTMLLTMVGMPLTQKMTKSDFNIHFYWIFILGSTTAAELLVRYCAKNDLKELREPWPLHIAADRGNEPFFGNRVLFFFLFCNNDQCMHHLCDGNKIDSSKFASKFRTFFASILHQHFGEKRSDDRGAESRIDPKINWILTI